MTILLTIERFVAVCMPLQSRRILTIRKSITMTTSIILFSILLNLPRWFEAQENQLEDNIEFDYSQIDPIRWEILRNTADSDLLLQSSYRQIYHGWIWTILMYGIPIPLLIGFNIKIWFQVSISDYSPPYAYVAVNF